MIIIVIYFTNGGYMKKYMIITLMCVQSASMVGMDRAVTAKAVVESSQRRKSSEKNSPQTTPSLSRSSEIPMPSSKRQSLSPQCKTPAEEFSPSVYWTGQFGYLNEVADSPKALYWTRIDDISRR